MTTQLEALKRISLVVADTGDPGAIRQYQPQDATTNPSLILQAFSLPDYQTMIDRELAEIRGRVKGLSAQVDDASDQLAVAIGSEIAQWVPGRISTEVSARLSFDTQASISKAHDLIHRYEKRGVTRDRVLIKLAATWEGILAAEVLEKEGIQCNLTLLFGDAQAQACLDAGVFLVSPFVGRVTDWYSKTTGETYTAEHDPGVQFVRSVCDRVSARGYRTIVMGASFRNTGQVLALAGCPRLTISPALLEELSTCTEPVSPAIEVSPREPAHRDPAISETDFRWRHNENAMATEKLAEGIRRFAQDQARLEHLIADRLSG